MITWWDILEALRAFLAEQPALYDAVIELGAGAAVPTTRTVSLQRGPDQPPTAYDSVPGELTVHVECWEHDDSDDSGVAYAQLATLEAATRAALAAWLASNPFPAVELKAPLPAWQPDGDMFRPSVGSRLDLVVRYRPRPVT